MINKMKKYICFIVVLCLFACSTKTKKQNEKETYSNDTIFVSYYPCNHESNIAELCKDFIEAANMMFTYETIRISKQDYDDIVALTKGKHVRIDIDSIKNYLCEPELLIQVGDSCVAIGHPYYNCDYYFTDTTNHYIEGEEELAYRIRDISHYYNCFELEDVFYDKLVWKYGFPTHYNFFKKNKSVTTEYTQDIRVVDPEDEWKTSFRKIALICNE